MRIQFKPITLDLESITLYDLEQLFFVGIIIAQITVLILTNDAMISFYFALCLSLAVMLTCILLRKSSLLQPRYHIPDSDEDDIPVYEMTTNEAR